jgi:hypothetical protein
MSNGNISPLEPVSQDVNMEDSYLTMHVSSPEGDPAQLAMDLEMARDELEKSGEFTQPKIKKIMASLPESSSPNDPKSTTPYDIDVAFNELYPEAMYAFSSPPPAPKKPSLPHALSRRRDTRSQSPPTRYPSYRHLRRNAIIPPLSPTYQPPSKNTALIKAPAAAATTTRPTTPSSTGSPFMDLPGELKNRIYFYALVRPDNIEITALNWPNHQPPLLKTCKQIRHEALSIFYNENRISANIDDWNPEVKNACHDLWAYHDLKSGQFSHYFTGKPHWQNLLAWLKAFFLRDMKGISDVVNKDRALERKTVGMMFLMAVKAKENRMLWKDLKEMLEGQRGLLNKGDRRWEVEN